MNDTGNLRDGDPQRSPYSSAERYEKEPKEDFKHVMSRLEALLDTAAPHDVADIGCANGELLYHLHKRYPHWRLTGYDRKAEFLETARTFPGLADVTFTEANLYNIEETFDVVIATLFLPRFDEIESPLAALLSLCRPGGYLLTTGLFNPHDIEVRALVRDNTDPEMEDAWRSDFNRHSRSRIEREFGPRVQWLDFEEVSYDGVEIPRDPNNAMRVWTLRTEEGKTLLINGAWQICNQTLMTARK